MRTSYLQTTLHSFYLHFLNPAFHLIVRKMEWIVWGGTLAAKTLSNIILPGSGAAIEFVQAAKCLRHGNVLGGATYIISGIADLCTPGLFDVIKSGMSAAAMGSAVQFVQEGAKSLSKEATKKLGKQFSKELARGVIPSAVEEAFFESTKMTWSKLFQATGLSAISSGGEQVGKTVFQDWIQLGITEMLNRKPMEIAFDFTKEAAKKGAKKEFMNQSYKLFVKELNVALLKGAITYNKPLPPLLTMHDSLTGNNIPNLPPIEEFWRRRRSFEGHTVEYCP